jgi:cytidylate kinase
MPIITIAIDGFSSTGKSTVAKQLADYLDYIYVDSGAMYRAVTYYAIQNGYIDTNANDSKENHVNREGLIAALDSIALEFKNNQMHLNGENVEKQIRSMEVSNWVSPIATIPEVRRKLVKMQHKFGENKGVVMDGRDIGTVVFPKAELKLFMNATAQERAMRRYSEIKERDSEISFEEVLANVTRRDSIDTTRRDSPLVKAADAIEIDNSEMNLEDQFHMVLQLAKDRIAGRI